MTSPKLILASASPRRRELLAGLGLEIDCVTSAYAEPEIPGASPSQLAFIHAIEKAREVASRRPGRLVLAADTVVDLDGEALGKPRNAAEAERMLHRLEGRRHQVHTAFALVQDRSCFAESATTTVEMYPLSHEEIVEYVRTGDPLDKAGAYGIQGRGAINIVGIEGDYFTVVGLPIAKVVRALRRFSFV